MPVDDEYPEEQAKWTAEQTALQAEFDKYRDMLQVYANTLAGVILNTFPPGYVYNQYQVDGSSVEYPLKSIADNIDNVLESFDQLQIVMGEKPHHTRHRRFLRGGRED